MDSKGREESISTNGIARSSLENCRRWEPEMTIMPNNGEKKKKKILPKDL